MAKIANVNDDPAAAEAALIAWFENEAWRLTSPRKLTLEACRRMLSAGVPLHQFSVFIFTLHPDYFGVAHRFDRDSDSIQSTQGAFSIFDSDIVRQSPIAAIADGISALRRRLDRPGFVPDYPVLQDYIEAGATDYVLMRLEFTDGARHCVTMTTDRPGGFSTAELALVDRLLAPMARLAEIQAVRYLATTLLDTYVGQDAGTKILTGNIRRGVGETIHAVIWLCDLRDFTRLSDALPGDELIALLNDYFDCMGPPVRERGGEILKFVGDAMLAIFRIDEGADAADASARALAAAAEAGGLLAGLNARRGEAGQNPIEVGIALHVGEVIYGNIGTGDRLDFTVIGPAVNLAARLESLCRELGRKVILSQAFAAASGGGHEDLGGHALKGVAGETRAFAPIDRAPAPARRRAEAAG